MATSIVLTPIYMLKLYNKVMLGPVTNISIKQLNDLDLYEYITLIPLALLVLLLGIYPNIILEYLDISVVDLMKIIEFTTK